MPADPDLIAAIKRLRSGHFPDATAVLLYGSALTGHATSASDVDLQFVVPGFGDIEYRTYDRDGQRFECLMIPHDLIPYVPLLSLRSKRPLGLFGFADGQVVEGAMPELEELRPVMRAGIAELNAVFRQDTLRKLSAVLTTVDAARLSDDRTDRIALAVRAVPALLEIELQLATESYLPNRNSYRTSAKARPDIVTGYADILQAVTRHDISGLVRAARELKMHLRGRAADETRQRIDPAQFGVVCNRTRAGDAALGR